MTIGTMFSRAIKMDVGYNGRLYDHFESTVGVLQKIAIAVIMYSWYK